MIIGISYDKPKNRTQSTFFLKARHEMENIKKGEYIQVLDREDGMYWDAIVKDFNAERDLVTVWIPLCKLKMTYHTCDTRKQVEERPLQRDSLFKRTDLRLLVRKRKIVYKNGDTPEIGEVKVNDPYEAYFELKNGELVPYERIIEVKSMSDDDEEEETVNVDRRANRRSSTMKSDVTSSTSRRRSEQLPDKTRAQPNIDNSQVRPSKPTSSNPPSDNSQVRPSKPTSSNPPVRKLSETSTQVFRSVTPLKRHIKVSVQSEKQNPVPAKQKVMVDANVNTVDFESFSTSNSASETVDSTTKVACPVAESAFIPELETNRTNDSDLQDPTLAQQLIGQTNFQLPIFNNSDMNQQIPTDLSNGNAPMVNLDFGTSSTSIYYPSTSCNAFPATSSSFQCSPSKGLAGFTPGLTFQSSLRGTSINYMPYTVQDNLQIQQLQNNNNNLGDFGNNNQLARLSDLVEKAFYEVKEQSILLRRILEGQETMVSHLAKIVQGISEATQPDDAAYSTSNGGQSLHMPDMGRTNVQNGIGGVYPPASSERPAECELQSVAVSDRNGMDLTVHSQYT